MMVPIAGVLIVCANFLLIEAGQSCDLGTLFYQELGCKPIYEEGFECPISYDCPKYRRQADKCTFHGTSYEMHTIINGTSACNQGCLCIESDPGLPGRIACPVIDCDWRPINSTCYKYKTKLSACCSATRCEPYGKIAKCEVEGKSLKEGESFVPKDTCYNCLCQKGYKGVNQEPFCKKKQCDTEINYSEEIENGCAPIYSNDQCCPSEFLCEKDAGKVKIIGSNCKDQFCSFGKTKVPLGGHFEATFNKYGVPYNVTCACKVPPLPMCVKI